MLKEKIQIIKNTESKSLFGRVSSSIHTLDTEIESFFNNDLFHELSFMEKVNFILTDTIDYYQCDFKTVFEKHLIRSDGKINSPLLKNKNVLEFIKRIDVEHPELTKYNFEHKWFYFKNSLKRIPCCRGCNKELEKFTNGVRFCSQQCAVTSDEAKQRSSETSKGRTHSEEQKKNNSQRMKELWKTENHRKNVLPKLKEINQGNGKRFLNENGRPWNYGISPSKETIEKTKQTKKDRKLDFSGRNNPQFGKTPSPKAGRGINGKYKNYWFRSSLELFYLLYFDKNHICFESAETKEYKVTYILDGITKTYSPDFYLVDDDIIVEIKPYKRIKEKIIKLKMDVLREKFGETRCEFRTERDIKDFIINLDISTICDKIISGDLELDDRQKNRLLSTFKRIKDECSRNF